jgi:hypothetical protein
MNKKTVIFIIASVLIIFVLMKFIFSQLCAPTQNKPIANIASSVASSAVSDVRTAPSAPEPLSWEPVIQRFVAFLSKACNR